MLRDFSSSFGRGIAAFLGGFSLLNLAGDLRVPEFDSNLWWIDFRPMPRFVSGPLLLFAAILFVAYAARPRMSNARRAATLAMTGVLLLVSLWNALHFWILLARGEVRSSLPLPWSLIIAMLLAVVGRELLLRRDAGSRWGVLVVMAASWLLFPLVQIALYGLTDYRRPADLIVVFGAGVSADGRPSYALDDRVRAACALYRQGLAPRLFLSGGAGPGTIDEPEAMRTLALKLGVPDSAMLLDHQGITTEATVANVSAQAGGSHPRVLAVSHFYHLPRVKMTFQRYRLEAFTVPAPQRTVLLAMPYYIAREDAAFWKYYLRRLL